MRKTIFNEKVQLKGKKLTLNTKVLIKNMISELKHTRINMYLRCKKIQNLIFLDKKVKIHNSS